jgi:hypothetical protein
VILRDHLPAPLPVNQRFPQILPGTVTPLQNLEYSHPKKHRRYKHEILGAARAQQNEGRARVYPRNSPADANARAPRTSLLSMMREVGRLIGCKCIPVDQHFETSFLSHLVSRSAPLLPSPALTLRQADRSIDK